RAQVQEGFIFLTQLELTQNKKHQGYNADSQDDKGNYAFTGQHRFNRGQCVDQPTESESGQEEGQDIQRHVAVFTDVEQLPPATEQHQCNQWHHEPEYPVPSHGVNNRATNCGPKCWVFWLMVPLIALVLLGGWWKLRNVGENRNVQH